jgi:hypothetical protein
MVEFAVKTARSKDCGDNLSPDHDTSPVLPGSGAHSGSFHRSRLSARLHGLRQQSIKLPSSGEAKPAPLAALAPGECRAVTDQTVIPNHFQSSERPNDN